MGAFLGICSLGTPVRVSLEVQRPGATKKEHILGQMEQFGIHLIIKEKGILYKKRVEHGSHFLKELQKLELLSEEPVIKSWQYQDVDPTRRD